MNITLTDYELDCLISSIEINEDIFREIIEDEKKRGREVEDYCRYEITMLRLLNKFRELRGN